MAHEAAVRKPISLTAKLWLAGLVLMVAAVVASFIGMRPERILPLNR
ncbi:MAG: hypothetical protein ACLFU7_14980 [Armatimonadota bacterium]